MSKARDLADLGSVTDKLEEVGNTDGALSNRNLIINGELIVNQRNIVSGGNVGNNTYTYDRWVTVQNVAANTSTGSGYENSPSIRMDATATGSGQVTLEQRIESPSNFDGLVVTVSAWAKSNSSSCFINIYDSNWNGIKSNAHTGGGGWELLTTTGTLSTGMTDLRVRIGLSEQANVSVTSGDYFEFTQCQLERGDTATPFEHRSYSDELQRCMRYCQFNTAEMFRTYSSSSGTRQVTFTTPMRANPTASIFSSGTNKILDIGTAYRNLNSLGGFELLTPYGGTQVTNCSSTSANHLHIVTGGCILYDAEL